MECLQLYNIVEEHPRIPAPPSSLQSIDPGSPEDPTPSLLALDYSRKLWQRELEMLTDSDVAVEIDSPVTFDTRLRDGEIQALTEDFGAPVERKCFAVGPGGGTILDRAIFHVKGSADSVPGANDEFGF